MRNWINIANILTEGKSVLVDPKYGVATRIYINPMPRQLANLCVQEDGLRGVAGEKDIYVWSAHDMIHVSAMVEIRDKIDPLFSEDQYSFGKMFFVGTSDLSALSPDGGEADPRVDIGSEWAFNYPWYVVDDVVVYAEHYDELEHMPAFMRMVGGSRGKGERC